MEDEAMNVHDICAASLAIVVRIDEGLQELIPGYLLHRQNDVQIMQEKLACGDYEAIRLLGHSIKGSGGGYGFDRITDIGRLIEDSAKEKNSTAISSGIGQLADYLRHVEVVYE